ncbi:TetR/AcrR family transcriptional regulator [Paenibacillus sp. MMO-177]|uniref:TetR/AcrR family transcriptional regulator n=1 Tax=Paenibacillus sp. MMO-177 TaxID=3081289 RepID=UPI003018E1F4
MTSRQVLRSEETKKSILAAASELFSNRGYDAVTMRDIARLAGCSHTTIYIYFKDKEDLLHQLSMPPVQYLIGKIEEIMIQSLLPDDKLKKMSLMIIEFCLTNRSLYGVFINTKSERVDEKNPKLEINLARNQLFEKLTLIIQECLENRLRDEQLLMYTRIYFFTLYGIIATYAPSEETVKQLMDRLTPTFEASFDVMLSGLRKRADEAS